MLRDEYISVLRTRLKENEIPNADGMIEFYEEMIADRMEDGMSEEEAVAVIHDGVDALLPGAALGLPLSPDQQHASGKAAGHALNAGVLGLLRHV